MDSEDENDPDWWNEQRRYAAGWREYDAPEHVVYDAYRAAYEHAPEPIMDDGQATEEG